MNAILQVTLIAVASFAAAGATWLAKGPPNRAFVCDPAMLKPGEICLQQVADQSGILWVDARSRKDWEASGVPGSILWNLDGTEDMQAFEAEAALKIAEGAARVIVYCGDENCGVSSQVAERIRKLDLGPEVQVLRGGWRALREAGRVKGSSPAS
jgi:rhodanese-related sulfurtransferase